MPLTPSSQPGEGLPAKVHLVLGVRIITCHSSSADTPCLSQERSYMVSSQPLEMHRDCALSGRLHAATYHTTTGNPRTLLGQAGPLLTTSTPK